MALNSKRVITLVAICSTIAALFVIPALLEVYKKEAKKNHHATLGFGSEDFDYIF